MHNATICFVFDWYAAHGRCAQTEKHDSEETRRNAHGPFPVAAAATVLIVAVFDAKNVIAAKTRNDETVPPTVRIVMRTVVI